MYCFENRGPEIGVTQPHPHGQIYAFPYLSPRTVRMLASARAYAQRIRRNLFDDIVAAELAALGPRGPGRDALGGFCPARGAVAV